MSMLLIFLVFVFILIVRHDVMMERSRKVFTLYRLQKYKKQMRISYL